MNEKKPSSKTKLRKQLITRIRLFSQHRLSPDSIVCNFHNFLFSFLLLLRAFEWMHEKMREKFNNNGAVESIICLHCLSQLHALITFLWKYGFVCVIYRSKLCKKSKFLFLRTTTAFYLLSFSTWFFIQLLVRRIYIIWHIVKEKNFLFHFLLILFREIGSYMN